MQTLLYRNHSSIPEMFQQYIIYLRKKGYTEREIVKVFESKGISITQEFVHHRIYKKFKMNFKVGFDFSPSISPFYNEGIFRCPFKGGIIKLYVKYVQFTDINNTESEHYRVFNFFATSDSKT